MLDVQRRIDSLTFHQDGGFTLPHNHIVNLFILFGADVRRVLGNHFKGIENVVPKSLKEGHDKRILRRLLCLESFPKARHTC